MSSGKLYYEQFNNACEKLQKIEEIGTIYCKKTENPIHIEENCIGIEHWAEKSIFKYSYEMFRRFLNRRQSDNDHSSRLLHILEFTRGVLIFSNDCKTAWNNRKTALLHLQFESDPPKKFVKEHVINELEFCRCVLRRNPKSEETFSHRRWLLENFRLLPTGINRKEDLFDPDEKEQIFDHEFNLCESTSERHPSNYNSWAHRTWLVSQMFHSEWSDEKLVEFLVKELDSARKFAELHISDYSPASYILNLLIRLFVRTTLVNWGEHWNKCFEQCSDLIVRYKEYNSLWIYRRDLLLLLAKFVPPEIKLPPAIKVTSKTEEVFSRTHRSQRLANVYMAYLMKFVFYK